MPNKKSARKSATKKRTTTKKSAGSGSRVNSGGHTPPPRKRARKSAAGSSKRMSSNKKSSGKLPKNLILNLLYRICFFFKKIFWFVFIAPWQMIREKSYKWPPSIKWIARLTIPPALTGLMLFLCLWGFYEFRAHSLYKKELVEEMPARTTIYDRNGEIIGRIHGHNRYIVKIDNVSKYFIKALIAREDARFYKHGGVDLRALARSAKVLVQGGGRQGGSTLSMQLADNSFSYKGKTIDGKFLEMVLARRIESDFTKDEILEMYMNRIFWGGSIRGIESASMTYFEKHASELTLSESAMLAGIISGPNAFSPFRHYDKAILKRDLTLRSMVQYEFITQADADEAMKEVIHIRPPERRMNKKSYVISSLKQELDVILEENNIKMGGLIVKTTLDIDMQRAAEKAVNEHLRGIERKTDYLRRHQTHTQYSRLSRKNRPDPNYVQGALVCLENHTGAIIAIVGGRDPQHSEFNRATDSKRQVGSIFKPFVYLSAFEKGMNPNQWISDERLYPNEIKGATREWNPRNSDEVYKPSIRISEALARSRNTASIRVGNYSGINRVIETARMAGFQQHIPEDPSIYLGSFSATPKEVATAYTAFPNDCIVYRPHMIKQITDANGKIVYPGSGSIWWDNTASKAASRAVSAILEQSTRTGTGRSMRSQYGFHREAAGKTGTTNDSRDGWFAGYTSKLTCAVWVGMDDNSTVYRGASGSTLALPIWTKFMKVADEKYPAGSISNRAIIVDPN